MHERSFVIIFLPNIDTERYSNVGWTKYMRLWTVLGDIPENP